MMISLQTKSNVYLLYDTMSRRDNPFLIDQCTTTPMADFARLRMIQSNGDLPRPFTARMRRDGGC